MSFLSPLVVMLVLAAAQDDSSRPARDWIEKLRSQNAQEREAATRRLRDLGTSALPDLEKASKDADPEVAARASFLARLIGVRSTLTPRFLAVMTGVDERIARGATHAWKEAFEEGFAKK